MVELGSAGADQTFGALFLQPGLDKDLFKNSCEDEDDCDDDDIDWQFYVESIDWDRPVMCCIMGALAIGYAKKNDTTVAMVIEGADGGGTTFWSNDFPRMKAPMTCPECKTVLHHETQIIGHLNDRHLWSFAHFQDYFRSLDATPVE